MRENVRWWSRWRWVKKVRNQFVIRDRNSLNSKACDQFTRREKTLHSLSLFLKHPQSLSFYIPSQKLSTSHRFHIQGNHHEHYVQEKKWTFSPSHQNLNVYINSVSFHFINSEYLFSPLQTNTWCNWCKFFSFIE